MLATFAIYMDMKEMKTYTIADSELCSKVRHYASLRYTISEIATLLMFPVEELRMRVSNPNDPLALAYKSGRLESQTKYREAVRKKAEDGSAWAIAVIEGWEMRQLEEELGCHE